jgi:putative endonuclease
LSIHLSIGSYGEQLATEWLMNQGFVILRRNYRFARKEIDIIAAHAGILHFIEVKTRRTLSFGLPEEQVNPLKMRNIKIAAESYLDNHPQWRKVQYDIIAISLQPGKEIINFFGDLS